MNQFRLLIGFAGIGFQVFGWTKEGNWQRFQVFAFVIGLGLGLGLGSCYPAFFALFFVFSFCFQ